jgi:hypothetical protein
VVLTDRTTVGTARHPLPKKFHTGTGIPHPVDESVRIENRKVKNGHAVWNAAFNGRDLGEDGGGGADAAKRGKTLIRQ